MTKEEIILRIVHKMNKQLNVELDKIIKTDGWMFRSYTSNLLKISEVIDLYKSKVLSITLFFTHPHMIRITHDNIISYHKINHDNDILDPVQFTLENNRINPPEDLTIDDLKILEGFLDEVVYD